MSKRGLQVVVLFFGVLPIVTGIMAIVGGPAGMLDGQSTTSTVDSEVRFMAVYWMAFGGFVLWLVPRVATATVAFRAMLGIMAFSGAARLLSTVLVGRPHPVLFAATFVELCVPVLLWLWQGRIAATAATA